VSKASQRREWVSRSKEVQELKNEIRLNMEESKNKRLRSKCDQSGGFVEAKKTSVTVPTAESQCKAERAGIWAPLHCSG